MDLIFSEVARLHFRGELLMNSRLGHWCTRKSWLPILVFCQLTPASAQAQEIPRGVAVWKPELGNVRARIIVGAKSDAVRVRILWRRRDISPEKKGLILVDAATGKPVRNVVPIRVVREAGDIVFQATSGPGEYDLYYLPFQTSGSPYFPVVTYPASKSEVDPAWLKALNLGDGHWRDLPEAGAIQIQSRTDWNRSDPMEVIAGEDETNHLRLAHPDSPFMVFPEDRAHPIRMISDLPERWMAKGPSEDFVAEADRGEYLSFQLGVWAHRRRLDRLTVSTGPLTGPHRKYIPASSIKCINQGGTDWIGRKFTKVISVASGEVAPIWMGVQVPKNLRPGKYSGIIVLDAGKAGARQVRLSITVKPNLLADAGDSDPFRMSRLRWLDSTIGLDDEVVAPYTPLKSIPGGIACLGRSFKFASTGLPADIGSGTHKVLSGPIRLVVNLQGKAAPWSSRPTRILHRSPGAITQETISKSGALTMVCTSKLEADGYVNYKVSLSASAKVEANDISLELPVRRDVAQFLMGMGFKGGALPPKWYWDWKQGYANNMVWLGSPEAGIQCKLKGPEESWDLFHLTSIPDAWSNGGKGGVAIWGAGSDSVLVKASSGFRELAQGQTLHFNFGLLVTPVKPLDPAHWSQRYDHEFISPEKAKANGATIINVHQGNSLNPNINYPFLHADKMAAYIKQAHALGLKVKIYYTVRELSNRVAEIWALRALGAEIFVDGQGGGDSWLQEHLVSHYKPAWHTPLEDGSVDAAIITAGLSRWHNYYLEGLSWLIKNVGIDGLYLDGIGYDREIMKRVRKVMDRTRPGCLIDFHCGNSFEPQYGMNSCANQFMEHFPYMNSLWFGEGYDYNESPDYWLTEISGIPYGMYGEMLQGNGNPWRGMIYGMTARYYSGADPKHIWKLWDDFGIAQAKMIGYWSPSCPVKTSDKDVLATAYVKPSKTLISIASWNRQPTKVNLQINWKALGLDPAKVTLSAPEIKGFQPAEEFTPESEIPVEPGKGWLIVVKAKAAPLPLPQRG